MPAAAKSTADSTMSPPRDSLVEVPHDLTAVPAAANSTTDSATSPPHCSPLERLSELVESGAPFKFPHSVLEVEVDELAQGVATGFKDEENLEEPVDDDKRDVDEAGEVKQVEVIVQGNASKEVRQGDAATSRRGRKKPSKTATRVRGQGRKKPKVVGQGDAGKVVGQGRKNPPETATSVQREKKRRRLVKDGKGHFLIEAGVQMAMKKAIESCQTQDAAAERPPPPRGRRRRGAAAEGGATVKCNAEAIKDLRQCSEEFVMRVIWVWNELAHLTKNKVMLPKSIDKAISMHLQVRGFVAAEKEAIADTTFLKKCFSSNGLKSIVQRSAVDPLRTT